MKVTIIGGGNIGTLMAAEISHKGNEVTVYTSSPQKWSKEISVYDVNNEYLFTTELSCITDSLKDAVTDAEMIFVTFPAQMFNSVAEDLLPYINDKHKIGVVPGSGGAEFAFKKLIDKGATLFGFQRVHSIARLKEYGHSVYMLGRKDELQVAAIPSKETAGIAATVSEMFELPCVCLPNYLSVTLTPSNPILHTTRLYSLFKDYSFGMIYPAEILFYESWDNASSEILIKCDDELQQLCNVIPLDLTTVKSLKLHYESPSAEKMTAKISGITAFKGIKTPMVAEGNGFAPDLNSRYFTSDFCFGLKILRDVASLFGIATPGMDTVWNWYCTLSPETAANAFSLTLTAEEFVDLYK